MGGLYVHLPFCPYVCPYCDFAKWQSDDGAERRYMSALYAEIAEGRPFLATTLYVGGGTPNVYAPATVAALVAALRGRFRLPSSAEASIEINPDLALSQGLATYREAGLNRVSIGAQSFDPGELRVLGRRHAPEDVAEVVRRARGAGFANVSVDLMFGTPGQTQDSWRASLDAALSLGVEHISAYGLTVEAQTPYERWYARAPHAFPGDDAQADLYAIAIEVLTNAGFEQYEISNFARPGFRCRHNANYWANGEYLGLGVGATSYLGGERRTTTRDRFAYERAALASAAIPCDAERLAGPARVGEAAMLALRTAEGIDFQTFAERYNVAFDVMFAEVLEEYRSAGLLALTTSGAALTTRGRFVASEVCCAFLGSR